MAQRVKGNPRMIKAKAKATRVLAVLQHQVISVCTAASMATSNMTAGNLMAAQTPEGRYGLVDKRNPSCVRPGFNTRVQY